METKRIQLRGISRSPSDRMTEDGGCAESLNAYIDNEEVAPVIVPKDITDSVQMPENTNVVSMFIHNTASKKNYIWIAKTGDEPYHILAIHPETNKPRVIVSLELDEEISDITSIGNTLIVATNKKPYYLLYKSDTYHNLGNGIALPSLNIVSKCKNVTYDDVVIEQWTEGQPDQDMKFGLTAWNKYDEEGNNTYNPADSVAKHLAHKLNELLTNSSSSDTHYIWPIVARYAVRLYNGSIITSVPFLIAPQNMRGYAEATGTYTWWEEYDQGTGANKPKERITVESRVSFYQPFVQLLDISDSDLSNWSDLIKSIEIYFSDQIIPAKTDSISVSALTSEYDYATAEIELGGKEWSEEDAILKKSVFFKVASYEFTEQGVRDLRDGVAIPLIKADDLLVKDQLDPFDDNMESHTIAPQTIMSFNNRLLAGDIVGTVNSGPKVLTSTDNVQDEEQWSFRFFIDANGEAKEVIRRSVDNSVYFTGLTPYTWITYPDVNCKGVSIASKSGDFVYIPMKEHPNLNCSYGYLGRFPLSRYAGNSPEYNTVLGKSEDTTYKISNKLYLSEVDNPMIFPIANRYTISSGSIIGMAVATKALSQGQFGQFPVYVFTTDGIWTMSTNAEGTFSSSVPLSREICNNRKSITPIDQEIVFTSEKGVLMLSGSQIVELSPNMNGRHYVMEPTAQNIIEGVKQEFAYLKDGYSDPTAFMAFIKDARIAYDYPGKRLVFFNEKEKYQYVYKLDTSTWHKTMHQACTSPTPLNSYPRCEVLTFTAEGEPHVLDFSTILDSSEDRTTERVILATRPFDLGEPDVLKVIKDIRVRGSFAKKAVNFILQGSQDGINFYTISTLRGKAWKMFRLILLADLTQHERISWVDIGYETRFTNRLI